MEVRKRWQWAKGERVRCDTGDEGGLRLDGERVGVGVEERKTKMHPQQVIWAGGWMPGPLAEMRKNCKT